MARSLMTRSGLTQPGVASRETCTGWVAAYEVSPAYGFVKQEPEPRLVKRFQLLPIAAAAAVGRTCFTSCYWVDS